MNYLYLIFKTVLLSLDVTAGFLYKLIMFLLSRKHEHFVISLLDCLTYLLKNILINLTERYKI